MAGQRRNHVREAAASQTKIKDEGGRTAERGAPGEDENFHLPPLRAMFIFIKRAIKTIAGRIANAWILVRKLSPPRTPLMTT
jgi:hypothetical protein